MINFYDQVPSVYVKASRDFQYLSWLINIVLNSVKHNVDDIYNLPNNNTDSQLTELLAMTLGFKVKRNYDQKQLAALVSIIPSILKCKGTLKAINLAGKALIKASGAAGVFECEIQDNCLIVWLPKNLVDVNLFTDLLPYILPAGLTCRIIRSTQIELDVPETELLSQNIIYAKAYSKNSGIKKSSASPISLFPVGEVAPNFANFNYERDSTGSKKISSLNAGLLNTSIIPDLNIPDLNSET